MASEAELIPVEDQPKVDLNYANQMRTERLEMIWKLTAGITTVMVWVYLALGGYNASENTFQLTAIPWAIAIVGILICRYLNGRGEIDAATWVYAIGVLLAMGYILYAGGDIVRQIAPMMSLLILFIVGLMLPMQSTLWFLPINAAIILGAPWLAEGAITNPSSGSILAICLSLVTAIITAQASSELFSIADWALENYRRERSTATRLYESRQEVERSLIRQRGLTTEIKTANEELAIAQKQAEEAKHFRGQFLANMSHELRTPLNAVIGFSETMLNFPLMYNNVELPADYRRDLEQIHSSGKHLLNIINDILDLSKIDAGRLEIELVKVDLEPIIKSVMSIAVGLVGGKPIKLTRDTPAKVPYVKGDPVRVRQILLNIYSNAAKFTEEGTIKLILRYDEENVTISIKDTGEGIHPNDMAAIFEEFRQGSAGRKKARAGSGLGMPITRQLLDLMGGEISVESKLGEGSTFSFTLPVYPEETAPEASGEVAAASAH